MRSPFHTQFATVFANEVLLNSKRVAPYLLMIVFASNALLWWGWGPAVQLGWATNSEYYILRNLGGFNFLLGLPIFNAVITTDPILRDFRLGVDQLIFSKPLRRYSYVLGKFFGSFFTLVCCQAVFTLTLLVLQAFRTSGMIVQPFKVVPYFKHFFFFVVISHLFLACLYFTVGTLTRNSKIAYGLAACFYPLYISYQLFLLKNLPASWAAVLDPMLLNSGKLGGGGFQYSAEFLNSYVVTYSSDMVTNRVVMVLVATACLILVSKRFAITEAPALEKSSWLNLSEPLESIHSDSENIVAIPREPADHIVKRVKVRLPVVARTTEGVRANLNRLWAAVGIELRLLRTERSLLVLVPLVILIAFLSLPFSASTREVTLSASYAASAAGGVLLFLLGMIVFYTGEAIHRDSEIGIESTIWTVPAPNHVFLLSKFLVILLLVSSLITLTAITVVSTQLIRGHGPLDVSAHLLIYLGILVPSVVFVSAAAVAANILLRDKYAAYAASIGVGGGLFYLYSQGYNHWLYNPVLYDLWTYSDLTGADASRIWIHRFYVLALAGLLLAVAHLSFKRKPAKGLWVDGHLGSNGWTLLATVLSLGVAVAAGLMTLGSGQ